MAGRSSTNSSIERYSRVNVCRSIATPAKPACENEETEHIDQVNERVDWIRCNVAQGGLARVSPDPREELHGQLVWCAIGPVNGERQPDCVRATETG